MGCPWGQCVHKPRGVQINVACIKNCDPLSLGIPEPGAAIGAAGEQARPIGADGVAAADHAAVGGPEAEAACAGDGQAEHDVEAAQLAARVRVSPARVALPGLQP
jgi:hypothetical protein